MSNVRDFERADAPAVAEMILRILRREPSARGEAALAGYIGELFCPAIERERDIGARVHVDDRGRLNGFLGVMPQEMTFEGRPLRAAVCTTWIVDNHKADPFAGARLLRAVLSGPQDLSFSESSNTLSTRMWRRMGAHVLAPYCLEYLRVIRPASFVVAAAAARFGLLRAFAPPARLADRLAGGRLADRGEGGSWVRYRPVQGKADTLVETDPAEDELARAVLDLLPAEALRPLWSEERLASMLVHARRKANHGGRVARLLRTRQGGLAGLFVYYGDPGGIGRVMQLMAAPGLEGEVVERLLSNAHERGLAAIRGRTQPALLDAMLDRNFAFLHASSTVFHSSRPELSEAALRGRAFLNGLSGESWTRLIGDRFD